MSGTATPNLGLEYLDPSQSEPEVKINLAWDAIDAAVGAGVGIEVSESGDSPAGNVRGARRIKFVGATVTEETDSVAVVTIAADVDSGGGGSDSGGSMSVSDGVTTVAAATEILFTSGATVTASGSVAEVAIAGAGGGLPSTIPDLCIWIKGDAANISSGSAVPYLQNACPWLSSYSYVAGSSGATRSASPLNSLGVLALPGSSAGRYLLPGAGPVLETVSAFVVFKATSVTGFFDFICGASAHSFEFGISTVGKLQIVDSYAANIASSAATLSTATWYQANVTYNTTSGAWAFRIGQAVDSSGTQTASISTGTGGAFYDPEVNGQDFPGSIAELIVYNRVLTLTEIEEVEAYLHTKWGV
jgi:hypothetical protein